MYDMDKISDNELVEDISKYTNSKILVSLLLNKDISKINELCDRLSKIDSNLSNKVKKQICENFIKTNDNNDSNDEIEEIDYFENIIQPDFPIEMFPDVLKKFILSLAESIQVSIDMPAVACLAVLATCLQGKFKVEIKKDWREPLSLFCTIIAPPAERKSAVVSLLTAPITQYEIEENERLKEAITRSKIEKTKLEKQKEQYLNSKKGANIDIENVISQLTNFKEVKKVKIFADDVTYEKLASLMDENNGCMSILSAEGGIFDIIAGKYSSSNNSSVDTFLKGHSADTLKVDRVGREEEVILEPHLTMLLAIQPKILEKVVNNTVFRSKGLIARFLFCNSKSLIGNRKFNTIPISEEVKDNYSKLIKSLLKVKEKEKIIYFSADSKSLLEEFHNEIEPEIKNKYYNMSDFMGKVEGAIARIATLIQLVKNIDSTYVESDNTKLAIEIGRYFIQNAENIFQKSELNEKVKNSKMVLDYLTNKNMIIFTSRDIQRGVRTLKNVKEVNAIIDELGERHYIDYIADFKKYVINPRFFDC